MYLMAVLCCYTVANISLTAATFANKMHLMIGRLWQLITHETQNALQKYSADVLCFIVQTM